MPAVRLSEPKRPVRIANCSGAVRTWSPHFKMERWHTNLVKADPGVHMYNQAKYGDVDVITGDYLAGMFFRKTQRGTSGSRVMKRSIWRTMPKQ